MSIALSSLDLSSAGGFELDQMKFDMFVLGECVVNQHHLTKRVYIALFGILRKRTEEPPTHRGKAERVTDARVASSWSL